MSETDTIERLGKAVEGMAECMRGIGNTFDWEIASYGRAIERIDGLIDRLDALGDRAGERGNGGAGMSFFTLKQYRVMVEWGELKEQGKHKFVEVAVRTNSEGGAYHNACEIALDYASVVLGIEGARIGSVTLGGDILVQEDAL